MDPRFQSSFIPKKPITAGVKPKGASVNLLSLISIIVFIAVVAGAVGVFFYQNYLNGSIVSDKQSLDLAQGQFDIATINDIIRLDSRINVAGGGQNSLLTKHIAVSNLFAALQSATVQTVRFVNFNFSAANGNALALNLSGSAQSFSDVALQSSSFNRTPYFKNISVSNLSVDQTGAVTFNMTMTVDPSLLVYAPPAGLMSNTVGSSTPAVSATTSPSNTTHP